MKNNDHIAPCGAHIARRAIAAGLSLSLVLGLAACGNATTAATTTTEAESDAAAENAATTTQDGAEIHYLDTDGQFTDRDVDASYDESSATKIALADGGSTVDGAGATADGSTVTIADEGTYVVSGALSDGQLVVDVADDQKVQLVLDGVTLSSGSATAVYVRNADKVFVTLADGSKNEVSATGAAATVDEKTLDGAIYSSDTLTINGAGSLVVGSSQAHGIVSKNDLKLCASGDVSVTAAKSALQAKDSVRATGEGTYTLDAGTDGVHAEYAEDDADTAEKGYIYVAGGTFDVTADSDGFDASYIMQVDGGTITVEAGDDGLHAEADMVVTDGKVDVTKCYEGLEGARVGIDGGDVSVVASDDGVNATGDDNVNTTGDLDFGSFGNAPQGTDGADAAAEASDGNMPAPPDGTDGQMPEGEPPALPDGAMATGEMPEGMEPPTGENGERPTPPNGGGRGRMGGPGSGTNADASDAATDADAADATSDGMPGDVASGGGGLGRGMGGLGRGMGGGMMDADDTALVRITGGTLHVDANGDGIDSNGALVMTGGEVQVDGPVNTGNGALDSGTEITITGGTLLATSAGGMEENATSGTTQPTFLASLATTATGTVSVADASGKVVATWSSDKQFNTVQMSSPDLKVGEAYTITCGETTTTITLDDVVTGEGTGMSGGRGMFGARGTGDTPVVGGVDEDGDLVYNGDPSSNMRGRGRGSANGGRPVNGSPVNGTPRGNGSAEDANGSQNGRSRERRTVTDGTINTEVMTG